MKPQSCKAKGRRLQQRVSADLLAAFPTLREDDVVSRSMSQAGDDVQLSPAARRLIPFSFEAKNVERLNLWQAWEQAVRNAGPHAPCVVLKRNRSEMLGVVRWSDLVDLFVRVQRPGSSGACSIPERLREIAAQLEAEGEGGQREGST